MASVKFKESELCALLGKRLSTAELREKIEMLGMPVDGFEGGIFTVDITPNRIDLLSEEGMARALASLTGSKKGLSAYSTEPSGMRLEIDKSVRGARPCIVMALARNVKLTDELLESLIAAQEKIHDTFGRNRKKVSIGLHDASKVKSPFVYEAVKEFTFTPLECTSPMTLAQVLKEHPKGKDYAHLVQHGKYPLLLDANAEVLSFPPIINGSLTALTPATKEMLIDVTGTSREAVSDALNVLCCLLADRGAKIFSIETTDGATPNLSPRTMKFDYKKANKLLGISINEKEASDMLAKMGHEYTGGVVKYPCYRPDITHWVDLAEEVAIAFDYNNIPQTLPAFPSIAHPLPDHSDARLAMLGLGYTQAVSWTLTNPKLNFTDVGLKPAPMADTINTLTADFTSLRTHLLPNLLRILSDNRHVPTPHNIFELGPVFDADGKEHLELCAVSTHAGANFSEARSALEALLAELGFGPSAQNAPNASHSTPGEKCEIAPKDHPSLSPGRSCIVKKSGKEIGYVGEISEDVRRNFGIELPVSAFCLRLWK